MSLQHVGGGESLSGAIAATMAPSEIAALKVAIPSALTLGYGREIECVLLRQGIVSLQHVGGGESLSGGDRLNRGLLRNLNGGGIGGGAFGTNNTTFTVFACETGDWRFTEEFKTEPEAIDWIKKQLKGKKRAARHRFRVIPEAAPDEFSLFCQDCGGLASGRKSLPCVALDGFDHFAGPAAIKTEPEAIDWIKKQLKGKKRAATPTATPAAGAVASGATVALATTTPDAVIRYTTDDSDPTETSPTYSSPRYRTRPARLIFTLFIAPSCKFL